MSDFCSCEYLANWRKRVWKSTPWDTGWSGPQQECSSWYGRIPSGYTLIKLNHKHSALITWILLILFYYIFHEKCTLKFPFWVCIFYFVFPTHDKLSALYVFSLVCFSTNPGFSCVVLFFVPDKHGFCYFFLPSYLTEKCGYCKCMQLITCIHHTTSMSKLLRAIEHELTDRYLEKKVTL